MQIYTYVSKCYDIMNYRESLRKTIIIVIGFTKQTGQGLLEGIILC